MNLPFRKQTPPPSNPIIPEMNGPVPQQGTGRQWTYWARFALLIVVGIALLVGIAAGGTWLYNRTAHDTKTVATTKQPSSSKPQSKSAPSKPAPVAEAPSMPVTSATPQTISNQSTSTVQQGQASQTRQATPANLSNSGPGDVLAVFVVASIAGAGIHRFVLSKKLT